MGQASGASVGGWYMACLSAALGGQVSVYRHQMGMAWWARVGSTGGDGLRAAVLIYRGGRRAPGLVLEGWPAHAPVR